MHAPRSPGTIVAASTTVATVTATGWMMRGTGVLEPAPLTAMGRRVPRPIVTRCTVERISAVLIRVIRTVVACVSPVLVPFVSRPAAFAIRVREGILVIGPHRLAAITAPRVVQRSSLVIEVLVRRRLRPAASA